MLGIKLEPGKGIPGEFQREKLAAITLFREILLISLTIVTCTCVSSVFGQCPVSMHIKLTIVVTV